MSNCLLGVFMFFGIFGQSAFGATLPSSPVQSSLENIEIDRIDIVGVTVFAGPILEGKLEISPGDRLSRLKVLATERNLQDLYVKHGYERVRVESLLVRKKSDTQRLETVLEFRIAEGKPVRVASVVVVPVGLKDGASQQVFKSKEGRIRAAIALSVGDVFDEEKLDEGKRAIQELLASQEYIGGRIAEVNAIESHSPSDEVLTPTQKEDVRKWVSLEIRVDMGEKVIFGYRGNEAFTQGALDSLVSEQRLLGLGKDYVVAIKARIEEEYHSLGYAKVKITPYVFESTVGEGSARRVSYVIEEGPRVQINAVAFDGNSVFTSKELSSAFFSRASTLVQHKFYVEKDVQKAADSLIEYLKERGYLSAKLVTINTSVAPRKRGLFKSLSMNILFYLYEGDQTRVHSVKTEGNTALSRDELMRLMKVQEDEPLNLYKLSEGLEAIKRAYRELGYLDIKILNEGTQDLVTYSLENRAADLVLLIEEGPQFKLSQVEIEGIEKTQSYVVKRELKLKEGEVLSQPSLVQAERSLRRMGIFGDVSIRTVDDPARPGYKVVRVVVREADRGILTFGPGYRYDLGMRAFGQLAFSNLWGMNHSVSLNVTTNRRFYFYNFGEGQVQLAYSWPWFLIPGMTFRPVLSAGRIQYLEFSADTLSLVANFDKQLFANPNITAYLSYSFESINQFAAAQLTDVQQMTLGTLTPKLSLDLRDNPLAPKGGFFGVTWADLSSPMWGSQAQPFPIAYYRVQFRGDYYLSLTKDIVWYFSFRSGFEQSQAHSRDSNPNSNPSQDAIPLIKQFTMGGVGSLRGFREQGLNFQKENITGSLSYVNYRTELDLPFAGALKFALFLDAANLLKNNYSFLVGLRYGTGFGFHYDTPVGPVSLDWGFNTEPRTGEDPYIVHFSVGVI